MTKLHLEDFMETLNLNGNTINEIDLQKLCIYPVYPKASRLTADNGQS